MNDEAQRLQEFGSAAAGHSAAAFAELFGRRVSMEPPRERSVAVADLPVAFPRSEERVAAVFVDLTGAVEGVAGLMLPASDVGELLRPLYGQVSSQLSSARARSAFGEIGNIALCAAAGGIAKLAGGVVVPSLPRIGAEKVGPLLDELLDRGLRNLRAYLVETELAGSERPLRLSFLWIPL